MIDTAAVTAKVTTCMIPMEKYLEEYTSTSYGSISSTRGGLGKNR